MFTLHGREGSGSAVVEAVLTLAGAPYKFIEVDREAARQAPFLALNPMGQVPVLILPDGAVMTESVAIVMHLCDLYPPAGLAPAPGSAARAAWLRWLLFFASSVYGSNMRTYYSERYTADPAGGPAVKEEALARTAREWAVYAEALGAKPFMLGGAMSAVDLYACMMASWNPDVPAFFARHANIHAMYQRVAAVPALAPVFARNQM